MPPKEGARTAASSASGDGAPLAPPRDELAAAADLEAAVDARARADAQFHVRLWRDGYEGSLEVSYSWALCSRALNVGAAYRARYLLALVTEARRLQTQLVVRAAAAALGWTDQDDGPLPDPLGEPARTFLADEWRVVAREMGVEVENEELRHAFARFARTAVARELAYLAVTRTVAQLGLASIDT